METAGEESKLHESDHQEIDWHGESFEPRVLLHFDIRASREAVRRRVDRFLYGCKETRQIGTSRSWLGCYSVVVNMVRNPKTPQAIAMNNLARITSKDLTSVTRDRNIPEVIRRMAKKQLEMRTPKKSVRKH